MKQSISLDQWIALSMQERGTIIQKFSIIKSGGMETVDGQVVSDGITIRDLMIINVGSMIEYLGDKNMKDILESFDAGVEYATDKLWKVVLKVALGKEEPKKIEDRPASSGDSDVNVFAEEKKKEGIFKN